MLARIKRSEEGFTLIELLIVIVIIGALGAMALPTFLGQTNSALDSQRVSDLSRMRKAIEEYRQENGVYPGTPSYWHESYGAAWNTLATDLSPYMGALPRDPKPVDCPPWITGCYSYVYGHWAGDTYDLVAQFANPRNPRRCAVKAYKFYLNNAYLWCGGYSPFLYDATG